MFRYDRGEVASSSLLVVKGLSQLPVDKMDEICQIKKKTLFNPFHIQSSVNIHTTII